MYFAIASRPFLRQPNKVKQRTTSILQKQLCCQVKQLLPIKIKKNTSGTFMVYARRFALFMDSPFPRSWWNSRKRLPWRWRAWLRDRRPLRLPRWPWSGLGAISWDGTTWGTRTRDWPRSRARWGCNDAAGRGSGDTMGLCGRLLLALLMHLQYYKQGVSEDLK